MSQDSYQLDLYKHGGAHVDRYTREGRLVGRYQLDGPPLRHNGRMPPPIPNTDRGKFRDAITRARP
jgi:hypothetical protein